MTEIMLIKLLDIGFSALEVGLARQDVLTAVAELQKNGATPEQLVDGIRKLRDDAIAKAKLATL